MKIKINIKDEEELYNSFDKYGETLSEDLISYINSKALINDNYDIEIISKNKVNQEKFNNAFLNYCDDELKRIDIKYKINKTKQIWMLMIGIIFIAFSIILTNKVNLIILEIISTIGSFSIWESADSFLLESKAIKFDKYKMIKLKNSNIKYVIEK